MINSSNTQGVSVHGSSQTSKQDAGADSPEDGFVDLAMTTIRENPVASLAIGVAIIALSRTSAGKVIRPAFSLAVSSGAAGALANAAIRQFARK